MKHENYIRLSSHAKVLLWEICYQYNGYNNGDLCAVFSVMQKRGFRSKGTLDRAIKELLEKGWISITRVGGRHRCTLYALTFQAIDECRGKLDVPATNVASRDWNKIDIATPNEDQSAPNADQLAANSTPA